MSADLHLFPAFNIIKRQVDRIRLSVYEDDRLPGLICVMDRLRAVDRVRDKGSFVPFRHAFRKMRLKGHIRIICRLKADFGIVSPVIRFQDDSYDSRRKGADRKRKRKTGCDRCGAESPEDSLLIVHVFQFISPFLLRGSRQNIPANPCIRCRSETYFFQFFSVPAHQNSSILSFKCFLARESRVVTAVPEIFKIRAISLTG